MLKFLLFLFSLVMSSDGTILIIEGKSYSVHDFYSRYPKKQWERADSLQRGRVLSDFISRELCVLEAKRLGFYNDPGAAVKIYNRSLQILVNESYEYFVARPLIPEDDLFVARNNARREVFVSHILIGHSGSYLGRPPQRTLDEALVLSQQIKRDFEGGDSFSVLAEKYSDDPGVKENFGEVGWVEWGATVPVFQAAAFSLKPRTLSSPVLTDFGYHLILVSDSRPSDLQYMDDDEYENLIINITKNSIRDLLKPAAIKYDQKMLEEYGVVFNVDVIQKILKFYDHYQKNSVHSGAVGSSSFLESLDRLGPVCVYNKKGYGTKWFARRLNYVPPSRQPRFETREAILSTLKTLVLQDIAMKKGFESGVVASFSYRKRTEEMVSELLYDAYIKHLISGPLKPDSLSIRAYYESNKNTEFMEDEKIIIREIKVYNRGLADSLLLLIRSGFNFDSLAQQYSAPGSGKEGLVGPFSRKQSGKYFDAASLLSEGEYSPVISASSGSFSIIRLLERFSSTPLELGVVYAQIESMLSGEAQNKSKKDGVDVLLNKYYVKRDFSFLY